MRQRNQSQDDDKLRMVLENMRYKDCTMADIQFLRSLITSSIPGKQSVTDKNFRCVSIITAKNAQKDEINRLGCQRFAQEARQELIDFYSDDSLKTVDCTNNSRKMRKQQRKMTELSMSLQRALWNLPHSSADKPVPGKLSLCIGMPVMIKCNIATELCITNGQEATVAGWNVTKGGKQQAILDVLFVELKNPPKVVQIEGLPKNVVPLTRSSTTITCKLPDDTRVTISRSQIEVLPNFAMTDFASQGKTRPFNPVDLNNCRSHQAYYTALSRSATATGTVILQGFDAKKITGKASGALRQELRDLELLDEITKLKYLSKLPNTVYGDRRNTIVHKYRCHRGMTYVPKIVHPSIKWNKKDPMLEPMVNDIEWKIVSKTNKVSSTSENTQNSKTNEYTQIVTPLKKCKRKDITPIKDHNPKAHKTDKTLNNANAAEEIDVQSLIPYGTSWHENSCAYDAVLSIMHSIWACNKKHYTQVFRDMNTDFIGALALDYARHSSSLISLESARDNLRRSLHQVVPHYFTWGQYTSVCNLLEYMLTTPHVTLNSYLTCKNNHATNPRATNNNTCCLIYAGTNIYDSILSWVADMSETTSHKCPSCGELQLLKNEFAFPLPVIALDFSGQRIELNHTFTIAINNADVLYKLRGIIYYGDSHFTSHVIFDNSMTWFHDGIATRQSLIYEGILSNISESLFICRGKNAHVAIYAQC